MDAMPDVFNFTHARSQVAAYKASFQQEAEASATRPNPPPFGLKILTNGRPLPPARITSRQTSPSSKSPPIIPKLAYLF